MEEKRKKQFRLICNIVIWSAALIAACMAGTAVFRLVNTAFCESASASESREEYLEIITDARADKTGCNLIFSVMPGDGTITEILLEILSTKTYNLDYISIPLGLTGSVPEQIKEGLEWRGGTAPKEISLEQLGEYFEGESLYQYLCVAVEEWTSCPVSFYTAIDYQYYHQMYENGEPTAYLKDKIAAITSRDTAEDFFDMYYHNSDSNLSLERRLYYAGAWAQTNPAFLYVYKLPAEGTDARCYAEEEAKELIRELLEQKGYTVTQEKYREMLELDDQEAVIRILNSTEVTGLAARFQKRLEKDGYYILDIGNYEEGIVNRTRIQVREEGQGIGLVKYFNDASYEVVKDLPGSVDVLIILGSSDSGQ